MPALSLATVVRALRAHYGEPDGPPTSDPFELVLWENVAYLARPPRRLEAFEALRSEVGTSPAAIRAADRRALERAAARGILKGLSADKLRECARVALEELDGGLEAAVRGPLPGARRALRRFPGIGEPTAEKILLFAGRQPLLAPESNGLRVLVRLGLVEEGRSYARTYAASRGLEKALGSAPRRLQRAHLLLQLHGRTLCKQARPLCEGCPLVEGCGHARRR